MSSGMRPSLRLLSLNVNGLRDANKRRTLFTMLIAGRWDVVALQETHHALHECPKVHWDPSKPIASTTAL